jgi:tRNA threonylcarbamoyladenosine biosynthesis protein TsaE
MAKLTEQKFKIHSEEDTAALAAVLAQSIPCGTFISLIGNLGAGKTFFVRQFAKQFGIETVTSPTFSLVNIYQGAEIIYHFDFYRLNHSSELYELGYDEYLLDSSAYIFAEWADLFPERLPSSRKEIRFEIINEHERLITLTDYE